MTLTQQIIYWLVVGVVVYGSVAGVLTVWVVLRGRSEAYRAKHEEFLKLKRHVEENLGRADEDGN